MSIQHDVNEIELAELAQEISDAKPMFENNIDLVKNVKVQLSVVLGDAELTVDELFNLKNGSVVTIDKETTQPLEIVLEGKVIARGTLVAVDDNFGIKITEIRQT
jgi:flagellar motor switch protein FliN/FliY